MNSIELIKQLRAAGFVEVSRRGSHRKFKHPDGRVTIVPHPRKDLGKGLVAAIYRQAGI